MNKLFLISLILLFFNSCSFHSKSKFWTKEKKITKGKKIIENSKPKNLFNKEKALNKEINSQLKIKLESKTINHNYANNSNNNGRVNYSGKLENISKYKFKKIKYFDQFDPEIIFHKSNLIFFDETGSIIKFNNKSDLMWKKNYYTKQEKKLSPILFFAKNENLLVVSDSISKYFVMNISTGNLLWSKYNNAPFISDIKIKDDNFFVIDSNNTLKCFSLIDGSLVWEHKSENRIIKSGKKLSIALDDDKIIFNNSIGDITAVDISNGNLLWITPTTKNQSLTQSYFLKMSDVVVNDNSVLLSNNDNQFFSIDINSGLINWVQKINTYLKPTIVNNIIFTVTLEGYLVLINNITGNIIRVTNVFDKFDIKSGPFKCNFWCGENKDEDENKVKPVGFVVGTHNIFLSTDNGKLLIIDISTGKTKSVFKVDNQKISRPFISNKNLFLIKDNSIIKLN